MVILRPHETFVTPPGDVTSASRDELRDNRLSARERAPAAGLMEVIR
jgi:hypothetical protein